MDNKPLEEQAENYTKSQLLKFDFNLVKPSFDKKGADLLIIDNIDKKYSKFLIVQCKGRAITINSTSVIIPNSYVEDIFVLFIYAIDEEKNEFIFLFFAEDIRKWNINSKDEYTLSFNKQKIQTKYFSEKIFNRKLADKIHLLLNKTDIKKYTSVIIDGIFLEKAIDKTVKTYSEIWPDKKFIKPDLSSVVKNILDRFDRYKTESKIVNCYLLLSESFDLESRIIINHINQNFITNNGNQVKVFLNKTNALIAFEVLEQLERLINTENIILVADDKIYENALNELKGRGVEIIVVMLSEHEGSRMLIKSSWDDILYPLGISIGLENYEL